MFNDTKISKHATEMVEESLVGHTISDLMLNSRGLLVTFSIGIITAIRCVSRHHSTDEEDYTLSALNDATHQLNTTSPKTSASSSDMNGSL